MTISRVNEQKPLLRFRNFKDNWKPIKIKDVVLEKNRKPNIADPLYSLTIEKGITKKTARYERSFLVSDETKAYKQMNKNYFAYNPMNLRFGALARHKENYPVKVSKYYDIFSCASAVNSHFTELLLKTFVSIKYYNRMATGSLEEKKRVHFSDFLEFEFPFPELKEQQKIADFLSSVDNKIRLLTEKQSLLQQYKKGVMQKLFSQEHRFKDDQGNVYPDWEDKKLEDISTITMGTSPSSKAYNSNSAGLPLIQGNADIKNRQSCPRIFTSEITKECFPDDILMSVRAPVGDISISLHHACIGRGICSIRSTKNNSQKFLYQFLVLHEPRWASLSQGSTFESVNSSDIKELKLKTPRLKEQQKIANFLSEIDKKIESVTKQVEHTQTFKKGLLQKMFV